MSDTSPGPGWWLASDGRWYPPEAQPDWSRLSEVTSSPGISPQGFSVGETGGPDATAPATAGASPRSHLEDTLASWAPVAAAPMEAPPVGAYPGPGPGAAPSAPGALPPLFDPQAAHSQAAHPQAAYSHAAHSPADRPVGGTSGGRFSRGLRLVGVGFTMVRDEPGLMLVPVVAFFAQLVIVGLAVLALLPGLRDMHDSAAGGGSAHLSATQWAIVVVAGVLTMFVSVVSHATIIARVMARFHGQQVSNTEAARAALTKSPQLMAWAFINYVVVSILRSIGNRGILGLLVGALLRAGWMLASFFVVPVILFEDKGALAAIKRSVGLCRARWGENIVGNGALGVVGAVAILLDVAVSIVVGMVFAPLGAVVGAIGLVAILLVLTVASAAFNAALYWYAVTDQSPGQYSIGDLQSAYRRNGRKSGALGF